MAKHKRLKAVPEATGNSNGTPDRSVHVHQRDKLNHQLAIRQRTDLTDRQKQLIERILDKQTRLLFIDGPAGTSKTFLAVMCGLMLLNRGTVSDILYIRSIAESASKSLGSLPGGQQDKLHPFLMPLYDKLDELLGKGDVDRLVKEKRVDGVPVNYLRGASFNARFIIADEAQNLDHKELTTLVTRLGEFSRMVVVGDRNQSDINGRSGFPAFYTLFDTDAARANGIHCFQFTKEDIVRSGILRFIVGELERLPATTGRP